MVNEQSAAERIRTVLAAASSLDVVSGCGRSRLIGRHRVGAGGELTLELPQDCRLATAATATGAVEVSVELTDIAPTAMRDRVRAQVTLGGALRYTGRGATDTESVFALDLSCAQLIEGTRFTYVGGPAMARARPDPLAAREAALLTHLATAHRDVVDQLVRLVPAHLSRAVRRVHPYRLDRFGLTLRLEAADGDHDVLLAFPTALTDVRDAAGQVRLLMDQARVRESG